MKITINTDQICGKFEKKLHNIGQRLTQVNLEEKYLNTNKIIAEATEAFRKA